MPMEDEADRIVETALARQDYAGEYFERMRTSPEQAHQEWLSILQLLFPGTPKSALQSAATDLQPPASELAFMLSLNRIIDQLGAAGAAIDARWAAPLDAEGHHGRALAIIQRAVRQLTVRLRVVDTFRFKVWDNLDMWDELELQQIGAFVSELSREAPMPGVTLRPRDGVLHQ